MIGAIIGAVVAYGASRSSGRRADRAQRSQQDIAQQQADLAREQVELARRQYQEWHDLYWPLGQQIVARASEEVKPDLNKISADNQAAFESQAGQLTRTAQRYGMNPADGAVSTSIARLGADAAKSEVFNRNRAREGAKQQTLNNMMGAYGMGSGMPGIAANTMNSGAGFMNAAAGGYGDAAAYHQNQANATASAVGQLAGSIPWGDIWSSIRAPAGSAAGGAPGASWSVPSYGMQPGPYAGGYQYPVTSTEMAKDNIQALDPNKALDTVMKTPVVGFNYNGSPTQSFGTIAERAPAEISNGKQVSLENQVGMLNGAVQALAGKVNGGSPQTYGMEAPQAKNLGGGAGAGGGAGGMSESLTGGRTAHGYRKPPKALRFLAPIAYAAWSGVNAVREGMANRRDRRSASTPVVRTATAGMSGIPVPDEQRQISPADPVTAPTLQTSQPKPTSTRGIVMSDAGLIGAMVSIGRDRRALQDMNLAAAPAIA